MIKGITLIVSVFPASAGVFPCRTRQTCRQNRIPRIRGGVSICSTGGEVVDEYSPHPRGCFRLSGRAGRQGEGIPRIRGGVSVTVVDTVLIGKYSPHPRGCFLYTPARIAWLTVFPASAGVFLIPQLGFFAHRCIPRIRGGVSSRVLYLWRYVWYSPHPRGCFWYDLISPILVKVFPASAGVFPS